MKTDGRTTRHIAPENLIKAVSAAREPFNPALTKEQAIALRCTWDGCDSKLTKASPFGRRCADHYPAVAK